MAYTPYRHVQVRGNASQNTIADYTPFVTTTYTRKWTSGTQRAREELRRLNFAIDRIAPKSDIFNENFNIHLHKLEYEADRQREWQKVLEHRLKEESERVAHGLPRKIQVEIKPAFGGKQFKTNHGTMLGCPTIFTPHLEFERVTREISDWELRVGHPEEPACWLPTYADTPKPFAPWPSKDEAAYEGSSRLVTDSLHRRFPPLPREPPADERVSYRELDAVPQYKFDDFWLWPDLNNHAGEILEKTHWIPEQQFTDELGEQLIGHDLMGLLNS